MNVMEETIHTPVAIVGAGACGLTAALALDRGTLIEVRLDPEVITTRATMTAIREAAIQKRSS